MKGREAIESGPTSPYQDATPPSPPLFFKVISIPLMLSFFLSFRRPPLSSFDAQQKELVSVLFPTPTAPIDIQAT